MSSVSEEVKHNIEEHGRIHWLLENTEARTLQLISIIEEFRKTHPIAMFPSVDGEILASYADRQNGWAIEYAGWRDIQTGEVHTDEKRILISARVTTRKPTAFGGIEVRLSETASEVVSLFVSLAEYLSTTFPQATWRNMLTTNNTIRPSYHPWAGSGIKEMFSLPVSCEWLIDTLKDVGMKREAKGGIQFRNQLSSHYKLGCIPDVQIGTESTELLWLYAFQAYWYPTDKPKYECILWRVQSVESGLQVEAFCKSGDFKKYFYQFIELAKNLSDAKQRGDIAKKTNLEESAVVEVPEMDKSQDAQVNDSSLSGRKTLLCNWWAYGETVLGRKPDVEEWQGLFKHETGRDSEHSDPEKSMQEAIKALSKKFRR